MGRALFLCVTILVAAAASRAEPARGAADVLVRLEYERGAGAERCPDARDVRDAVAARLGYAPFSRQARRVLRAEVRREGRSLVGLLVLIDAEGQPVGTRELRLVDDDCVGMAESLVTAMCIAIDPLVVVRPPGGAFEVQGPGARAGHAGGDDPRPDDDVPPLPAAALPSGGGGVQPAEAPGRGARGGQDALRARVAADRPPTSTARAAARPASGGRVEVGDAEASRPVPLRLSASIVGTGGVGAAPGVAAGLALGLAAGAGAVLVGVELAGALPSEGTTDAGARLRGDVQSASLVPCVRFGWGLGCAVLTGGVLRADGLNLDDARPAVGPYAAFGGRLGLDVPLAPVGSDGVVSGPPLLALLAPFSARLQLDVAAPVVGVRLVDRAAAPIWSTSPVVGSVGAGIAATFP